MDIFDIVKTSNYEKIFDYIHIDLNIRDENNVYLLNYSLMKNDSKMAKILLDNGAQTDIKDDDGKSILYYPIKYDNIELIKNILLINSKSISISIHNIKDNNGNISIHYAIKLKKLDIVKLLIDNGSNVNYVDKDGNNSLHLAIMTRKFDIVKAITPHITNINLQNGKGNTAIQLAAQLENSLTFNYLLEHNEININIRNHGEERSPLITSVVINNNYQVNKLINAGADVNVQDYYGNMILHYAIINDNLNVLSNIINNPQINFNLWNIYGNLPFHIVFSKKYENYSQYMDIMINKTNLNTINNRDETCFYYICKFGLWKKYKNILIKKKLNIIVRTKNNDTLLQYINNQDINEFTNVIVESYIFRLRNSNKKWNSEWENICKNELHDESILDKFKVTKSNKYSDLCMDIVATKIKSIIDNGYNQCSIKSHPVSTSTTCINIDLEKNIDVCTITGGLIDVLVGLIYLFKKHPETCGTIDADFTYNDQLYQYYADNEYERNMRDDIINFEIIWVNENIFFSTNFDNNLQRCIRNKSKKFIIIPVSIEYKNMGHANYILYNKETNEAERFEPHGMYAINYYYNDTLLDSVLSNKFKEFNITYISPKQYLPRIGFQSIESVDKINRRIGDPKGFCVLWSVFYVDMRITYINISRDKLVQKLIHQIREQKMSFRNLIRNYSRNIIDLRDSYLKRADVDINDWMNDNIDDNTYNSIIDAIRADIA